MVRCMFNASVLILFLYVQVNANHQDEGLLNNKFEEVSNTWMNHPSPNDLHYQTSLLNSYLINQALESNLDSSQYYDNNMETTKTDPSALSLDDPSLEKKLFNSGSGKRQTKYDMGMGSMGIGKRGRPKYDYGMGGLGLGKRSPKYDYGMGGLGLGKRSPKYDYGMGGLGLGKRSSKYDYGMGGLGLGKRSQKYDYGMGGLGLGKRYTKYDYGMGGLGLGKRSPKYDFGMGGLGLGKRSLKYDYGMGGLGLGKRSPKYEYGMGGLGLGKRSPKFDYGMCGLGLGKRVPKYDYGMGSLGLGKRSPKYDFGMGGLGLGKRDQNELEFFENFPYEAEDTEDLGELKKSKRNLPKKAPRRLKPKFDPGFAYIGLGKKSSISSMPAEERNARN